jgi:hypothetical protein
MHEHHKNKLFNPPPFLFVSSKETAKERSKKVKKRGWDTTRTMMILPCFDPMG